MGTRDLDFEHPAEALRTKSADRDHDGAIRISELRDTVASRVRELTAGRQNPTARRENLESDFALE